MTADFTERIREVGKTDARYAKLVKNVGEGVVRRYWVEDGLLYAKGGKLFVPKGGKLRLELMREHHDGRKAEGRAVQYSRVARGMGL